MDVAKRQEVLNAVIVIQPFAVEPLVSLCEPAALDHPSFHLHFYRGNTRGKATQGGIMPHCESIKR